MRALRARLARLEAVSSPVEFWLNLVDGHVTRGRTGERLSLEAYRQRPGGLSFAFTFELDSAAGVHDPRH